MKLKNEEIFYPKTGQGTKIQQTKKVGKRANIYFFIKVSEDEKIEELLFGEQLG